MQSDEIHILEYRVYVFYSMVHSGFHLRINFYISVYVYIFFFSPVVVC